MCRRGGHGFTLVEMVIVLVIIAVGTGIVIPMVDAGINAREVRRAARQLASSFHHCRNEAVARGSVQVVGIDPLRNTVFLGDRNRWAALGERAVIERAEGDAPAVGGVVRVLCFPNGSTSGADIQLASRADRSRDRLRLRLDPLLGRVDVLDARG
ncbi:MAG: prepilin-type N-terminal cleavage/methylation domain-containing protein [Candidatus Binatia bacterium]